MVYKICFVRQVIRIARNQNMRINLEME